MNYEIDPPISRSTVLERARNLTWRRIGNALIVVGAEPAEPELIGEPAALVWDLLGRQRSVADLVDDLVSVTGSDDGDVGAYVIELMELWSVREWVRIIND